MKLFLLILVISVASLVTSAFRFPPTRLTVSQKTHAHSNELESEVQVEVEVEVDTSSKYFSEPGNDQNTAHYDARYYTGSPVSDSQRAATLHHMIRAYVTTFRNLNLETWIAHGTLLGWWWNGQILPWDWDIDVQVSAATLSYLAAHYNSTIHSFQATDDHELESQGQDVRKYFLDVNPWQFERVKGDGMNIIDARWIDMSNGLFIDITGIAVAEPETKPGVWSCKNGHDYAEEDIWPVRETIFEGVLTKVPNAFAKVLVEEYTTNALTVTTYDSYKWDNRANAWIYHEPEPVVVLDPDLVPIIGEPLDVSSVIVEVGNKEAPLPLDQQSLNPSQQVEQLATLTPEEMEEDEEEYRDWVRTVLNLF